MKTFDIAKYMFTISVPSHIHINVFWRDAAWTQNLHCRDCCFYCCRMVWRCELFFVCCILRPDHSIRFGLILFSFLFFNGYANIATNQFTFLSCVCFMPFSIKGCMLSLSTTFAFPLMCVCSVRAIFTFTACIVLVCVFPLAL